MIDMLNQGMKCVCVWGGGGAGNIGVCVLGWGCVCSTGMTLRLVLNPFKNRFFLVSYTNLNSVFALKLEPDRIAVMSFQLHNNVVVILCL